MIRTSWAILIVLLGAIHADAQGRLQGVRDEVTRPASSSNNENNNDADSGSSSDSSPRDSEDYDSPGAVLSRMIILAPFYVPMAILNDEYDFRLDFTPHPYARGYHGYQILKEDWANIYYSFDASAIPRKSWAVRLSLENGNDFDGLNRFAGQLKVEHESRFGFTSNWHYFAGRLPCGCIDETVIGDTNVTYRFAQNEVASMYSGLGFRVLTDRKTTNFGFNFTYGGDWFPVRPLIVSGVIDAGSLGSAFVFHARGSVGAIWHGCEVFAGYDYLRIGSVDLQGPMAGVRLWF